MSTGTVYRVGHRVLCSKGAKMIFRFGLLPHDLPEESEKLLCLSGRRQAISSPAIYRNLLSRLAGIARSQGERFPAVAFRLISQKKAHRLIACEVILPGSKLMEDESWVVRPLSKPKGL